MSFHEKNRWVALLANLLVWGWYFIAVLGLIRSGIPYTPYLLGLLIPVVIGLTIIHIVGHTVVAITNPKDAETSATMDERERSIRTRASANAYELLNLGLVIVLGASLYYWDTFLVINGVLFVFVLAESFRYIIEISAYRRGVA